MKTASSHTWGLSAVSVLRLADDHLKDEGRVRQEPIWDVINKEAADNAVFAIDVGNVNMDHVRLLNMNDKTTSGLYASMGYGSPAAIAAATAMPDRGV